MARQIVWLVCPHCGVKEWLHDGTQLVPCPNCLSPRHAEDNDGNQLVLWSKPGDPYHWPRMNP